MNVGEISQRETITIRPKDDLLAAAKLMREKHVGYLIVVEPAFGDGGWRPVGVLTDRDIVVSVVARDASARDLRVEDVMTREPVTTRADASLDSALLDMRRIGSRRLPVIGSLGELTGVIALDDVVEQLAGELQHVAGSIRSEQQAERIFRP